MSEPFPPIPDFGQCKPLRVIVVGAGLAGLAAAYELEQRGHSVVILEAERCHIGGRARTQRFEDGLYGELGAMRIPGVHHLTRHYVRQFGLTLRRFVQSNDDAYLYVRGNRVRIRDEANLKRLFQLTAPESEQSATQLFQRGVLDFIDSLTLTEKDALQSPDIPSYRVHDADQRSLQQLLQGAHFSAEAIEYLASIWGLETSLSTAATETLREELRDTWKSDTFSEIVGGTDLLATAFVERLQSPPRLGCKVVALEQTEDHATAVFHDPDDDVLRRAEGDFLICTLPLPVLSCLKLSPVFSAAKCRAIRQINYDSSTKVLAVTERRFWEQNDGIFGGGSTTDLPIGFVYYPSDNASARDPKVSASPAVLLASYTWGQVARRLAALSTADARPVVLRDLSRLHPDADVDTMVSRLVKWSWDNHPGSGGAFCWFLPGQQTALYPELIRPEGRIYLAGEHASLTHTWMQGAFESARHAVSRLLERAHHDPHYQSKN